MSPRRTSAKSVAAAFLALALLASSCGSNETTDVATGATSESSSTASSNTDSTDSTDNSNTDNTDSTDSSAATAVPVPAEDAPPPVPTDVPVDPASVTMTDEEQRKDSYQTLILEGQFDPEDANCVLDGLYERTGNYSLELDPALDASVAEELQNMVLTCQGIEIPVAPSAEAPTSDLTIEEWRQGAGDFAPESRNGVYAAVGYPPMTIDETASYVAVMTTASGEMRFQLSAADAPITVNNFVNLAEDGYFDGVTFHRVIEGFMAQGGDPSGSGSGGPGYQFPNEFTEGVEFVERGQLAMANAGMNTNGSQFFITFTPSEFLGGANYTIFGSLLEGDDVLASVDMRDPGSAVAPGTIIESVRIEVS